MDTIASLGLAIVGAVELVKRLFARDLRAATIIVVSAIVGAVLGPQVGMPWFQGLLIGLSGSGLITTASYIGGSK